MNISKEITSQISGKKGMTVLIVEDDRLVQQLFCLRLSGKNIRVLQAYTKSEAKKILTEKGTEIDFIIFDGFLNVRLSRDERETSLWLVEEFRNKISSIMIAASSDEVLNGQLVKSWCDYKVSDKWEAPKLILQLISK